ncbi:hypothetical protein WJC50_004280 [Klebsiella aerogenes]
MGEDIVASPLHITRKKNLLARTTRYPNLCILHDRVLLPRNFHTAVQHFGDDFPLTGFQSFWFAGAGQTLPLRYSDFGMTPSLPAPEWSAARPSREEITCLAGQPLYAQHPARSDFGRDYLTGSLYLCKRSVWAHIPQNEALFWQDYEDLEQAFSAAQAGIPSRVNPYTLTQSLSYRSVMHYMGTLYGITRSGWPVSERPWGTFLLPHRPHLPVRETEGYHRLRQFASRYTTDALKDSIPLSLSGIQRYRLIARLLWAAEGNTDTLLRGWYQLILCESPAPDEAAMLEDTLNGAMTPAEKKAALLRHPTLVRLLFNNVFSSPFQPDVPDMASRFGRIVGSLLSALWLTLCGKRPAMSEPLQQGSRARVVVLFQTGKMTPPQVIWPALALLCATTQAETPGVTLILTGNYSLSQQRDWTHYLSLSPPGAPPTGRLLFRFALYCLPPAVAGRAVNIARRIFRRGSARA